MKKQLIMLGTALLALFVCAGANAAPVEMNYLGLELGATQQQVVAALQEVYAVFDADYGYRGYTDLSSIKVRSFSRFPRLGSVPEAWLDFDPDGCLYRIRLTYNDLGDIYKVLSDGLVAKYGSPQTDSFGFRSTHLFRDGEVEIILDRDTFGFGSDQRTSLKYTLLSAVPKVAAMMARIEADIAAKNAAAVGGDL